MEKFMKFVEKYNLKELGVIFVFSLLLFWLFYGKQDAYLIDVGREAYLPWQMLEGKVLYKDLFNVYGPLGYQINALAYMIFGIKLETLYLMGFLNSLVISFSTFFIVKLFADKKIALCVVSLTMAVCIYIRTFFNLIFSYSYCALYALSSVLLSLLAMLLYIREKKFVYLMLSFLFGGFAFANKIEYLPYFCLLFLALPFVLDDKKDLKKYVAAAGMFLIFPALSFGVLIFQGVSAGDFLNAAKLVKGLVNTPAADYFYNAYGLYFNPLILKWSLIYLWKLLLFVVPCAIVFYGLNFVNKKYFDNKYLKMFLNTSVVFAMFFVVTKAFSRFMPISEKFFCWVGIWAVVAALGFCVFYVYKYFKNNRRFYEIERQDKMFFFLLLSSILLSVKGIVGISTGCYGTFALAVLFLPFVVFFVNYLPRFLKFLDKDCLNKTVVNLCFIVVITYLCANITRIGENKLYPVKTDRGRIAVSEIFKSQNDFIHYVIEKTPKDSVIVSVPEGAIINFLSSRKSSDLYYYLIPVNVQIFGEEKIIEDFKKNPPDYFIMNNVGYTPFNVGNFCSYAKKVCNYIETNYNFVGGVDNAISFGLYKKK